MSFAVLQAEGSTKRRSQTFAERVRWKARPVCFARVRPAKEAWVAPRLRGPDRRHGSRRFYGNGAARRRRAADVTEACMQAQARTVLLRAEAGTFPGRGAMALPDVQEHALGRDAEPSGQARGCGVTKV